MTEISFHFNVSDKLFYTCRLLRKAFAGGASLAVAAEPEVLSTLDELLWSFSATDFVPHGIQQPEKDWDASVEILLIKFGTHCSHHGVLVNLGLEVPEEFQRFERCIEVVTVAEGERLAARKRWKHYANRGYALQKHDFGAVGVSA